MCVGGGGGGVKVNSGRENLFRCVCGGGGRGAREIRLADNMALG